MHRFFRSLAALAIGLPLSACSSAADDVSAPGEEGDGVDDAFVADGKSDAFGVADGSAEACAVLRLTNEADLATLDHSVKLHASAAKNIILRRNGNDSLPATRDDVVIATLGELDAVPWVGPIAFKRLLAYAKAHAEWACGEVDVQLLGFNDFHGNLKPPSGSSGRIVTGPNPTVDFVEAGGVEFFATHVEALRATNPNTFVVAAGDLIGASPLLSGLFHDEPTIEAMNLLGLAVASVGNHEFDEGIDELLRMQEGGCHPVDGCMDGDDFAGAGFQYLAANVRRSGSKQTVLPGYQIRYAEGAKIGFIGLTLEGTPLVTTASGVAGLTFADEAETVNALVPVLQKRGVETIVVLIHEGGFATGLYNGCSGISGPVFSIVDQLHPAVDVVVSGHTNAAHICEIDGKLVTSAANYGRLLTDIDLRIDARSGKLLSKSATNVIVDRKVEKHPAQNALLAKWDALAAPLANSVVGSVAADLLRAPNLAGESALGDVIADAQLAASKDAVVAFMNPGGIRADIVYAQVSGGELAGQVTYGELFAVQPFGNNLVTLSLTGQQIELLLEQQWSVGAAGEKAVVLQVSSGFSYSYDPTRTIGDRIDPASITIDGVPLDPQATYRVAVNSFLSDGGDGFSVLTSGTDRVASVLDLDALVAHFVASSPLAAGAMNRIVRL